MKTHCGSCNKSSINFLHKPTGAAYCSNCGAQMKLSIEIINALSSKKMFLPDDFFAVPAGPTRSLQQIAAEKPAQTLQPSAVNKQDAQAAALARRAYYTAKTKPDSSDGVKTITIPKVSREEAAAAKARALANIEQIAATAEREDARADWFKNRPSLAEDVEKASGQSLLDLERMIDFE